LGSIFKQPQDQKVSTHIPFPMPGLSALPAWLTGDLTILLPSLSCLCVASGVPRLSPASAKRRALMPLVLSSPRAPTPLLLMSPSDWATKR
jgi:hypothetical protein